MYQVVVFNDTRPELHFGCDLVFRNMGELFEKFQINVCHYVPIGHDWRKDNALKKICRDADAIIVNGEGSIHHDTAGAKLLSEIGPFSKEVDTPAFLINATIQSNGPQVYKALSFFRKIYVRESESMRDLLRHGLDSEVVADLTLTVDARAEKSTAEKFAFTDSVDPSVTLKLYSLICNENPEWIYMPIERRKSFWGLLKMKRKKDYFNPKILLSTLAANVRSNRHRDAFLDDYLNKLSCLKGLVSGRFHSFCMALHYQVPVTLIRSNSHKIESMLIDIGLDRDRVVSALDDDCLKVKPYSDIEINNICEYLVKAKSDAEKMFSEIVKMIALSK